MFFIVDEAEMKAGKDGEKSVDALEKKFNTFPKLTVTKTDIAKLLTLTDEFTAIFKIVSFMSEVKTAASLALIGSYIKRVGNCKWSEADASQKKEALANLKDIRAKLLVFKKGETAKADSKADGLIELVDIARKKIV
jgi:hypothetical protein